jgi:hypothetical protein
VIVEFILIASVLTRFSIGLVATGIYTLAFVTVEGETLATLETSFHVPFRALPLFTMARVLHKVVRVSLCGTGVSIRFFANLRMLVAFAVFVVEVPPLTLLSTRMSVRVLASLGFPIGFGMFVALAIFFDKVPAMSFVGTGVSVGVFASLRCRVWLWRWSVTLAPLINPVSVALLVAVLASRIVFALFRLGGRWLMWLGVLGRWSVAIAPFIYPVTVSFLVASLASILMFAFAGFLLPVNRVFGLVRLIGLVRRRFVLLRWIGFVLLRWVGLVFLRWSWFVFLRRSRLVLLRWVGLVFLRWSWFVFLRRLALTLGIGPVIFTLLLASSRLVLFGTFILGCLFRVAFSTLAFVVCSGQPCMTRGDSDLLQCLPCFLHFAFWVFEQFWSHQ